MCDRTCCSQKLPRRNTRSSARSDMACEPCSGALSPSYSIFTLKMTAKIISHNHFVVVLRARLPSSSLRFFLLSSEDRSACEKCGKKHGASECPFFQGARFEHADAQPCQYQDRNSTSKFPPIKVTDARVQKMRGDGDCLFHALNHNGEGAGKAK